MYIKCHHYSSLFPHLTWEKADKTSSQDNSCYLTNSESYSINHVHYTVNHSCLFRYSYRSYTMSCISQKTSTMFASPIPPSTMFGMALQVPLDLRTSVQNDLFFYHIIEHYPIYHVILHFDSVLHASQPSDTVPLPFSWHQQWQHYGVTHSISIRYAKTRMPLHRA